MRIKRTYAATMREALALVKKEQGADAVILGNKKVPGGVEILSAIDFDHQANNPYAETPTEYPQQEETMTEQQPQQQTRLQAVNAASNEVPDFILSQTESERLEPVLGLASTATPNESQPQAPVQSAQMQPVTDEVESRPRPVKRSAASPVARSETQQAEGRSAQVSEAKSEIDREQHTRQLLKRLRKNPFEGYIEKQEAREKQKDDAVITEVKDELKSLRDLMQSQLNVLEWDRYSQRHPVRTILLNLLTELGLGTDVIELILTRLGDLNADPQKVWQQALALLSKALPVKSTEILSRGGRIALVGSTGVGKTTTIAKLAARFSHHHGKRAVALITTDNFRIGAHEQLQHFARMLEIPLLTASNSEELTDRLGMLEDKKLVLIDTAGMSQTDVRLSEQFHQLKTGSPEIKPYLVLSANTQMQALNETVKNFDRVKLDGAIVTKLDESASLGGIMTTAIRYQLPMTYCGTGQRVPEDLKIIKGHQLVSRAVSLMQKYGEQIDKDTLAYRYHHLISQ